MVTMKQIQDLIVTTLSENADYLGLPDNYINSGVVGNSTGDEFTTSNSFVRVYTTGLSVDVVEIAEEFDQRPARATILCGWSDSKGIGPQSVKSYELAERVERVIIEKIRKLRRDATPIFVFNNDNNMSIHGVTFFFTYDSSAGAIPDV